jgi:ribosomal-protein-alanine N-acetyltransferase
MIAWCLRFLGRSKPRIAPAGPRDVNAVADLHARSFHRGWSEEEVAHLLADRAVTADCLRAGNKFAGFILSRRAADEAEILSVAVADWYRGRGLSRLLLERHLRRLAGEGARAVFLEVDEGNRPALALYRGAGFREVGRRPNYYPQPGRKPTAALVMRRDLA